MARNLQQTPNIAPPSTDYPNGNIVDEASGIPGTSLSQILYGDLMVSFHKLMDEAGISFNNLPDNETNGYQALQGLFQSVLPEWKPANSNIDLSNVKFVTYGQEFYYHKTSVNTNNAPNLDSTNWYRVFYWDGVKINFGNIITETLDIGVWNMTNSNRSIPAPSIPQQNILSINAVIVNDLEFRVRNIVDAGIVYYENLNTPVVFISRTDGGVFDNSSYYGTSVNRGKVTITYLND